MPYVSQLTDPDYLEMLDAAKEPSTSELVREFHKAFKVPPRNFWSEADREFRLKLITEEYKEVADALGYKVYVEVEKRAGARPHRANFLKELCDLKYVTDGAAVAFEMDIDTGFTRVHESNMSKLDENGEPIFREDGKVLKGPNYKEPVLEDLV